MSIKPFATILFATATALALSACGSASTPSTPAASAEASSAAATDPSTAPMSGIIFAAADDGIDTTVTTVRAIDPEGHLLGLVGAQGYLSLCRGT